MHRDNLVEYLIYYMYMYIFCLSDASYFNEIEKYRRDLNKTVFFCRFCPGIESTCILILKIIISLNSLDQTSMENCVH